ncbi:hypothetical protein [Glutamicibacter creatinolyticus]|uniref:hypothetical protein n=1 Tax=Glutamicibacter creatinolyticus TaxID=162496 RepID=UPI0032179611
MDVREDNRSRLTLLKSASRKMWILTAILGLLGASVGFVVGHSAPRALSASTVILVTPLEGNPFYPGTRGEQLVNLTTEAQVLKSDKVASKVTESMGLDSETGSFLRRLSTTVPPNTQLIEVTFEHNDRDTAVSGAQAFADSYLEFRSDQAATFLQGQITGIQEEIGKLTESIGELTQKLNNGDTQDFERTLIEAQLNSAASQIASLGARESTLATTRIDPGQVVTRASLDRAALLGVRELLTIAGLFGGLGLGVLVMVVTARSNKILRRPDELRPFGVNAMHVVSESEISADEVKDGNPVLARLSPELTHFRSQLLQMVQNSNRRVLLIAPADEGSDYPRSYSAVAETLVTAGLKTLVIDTTGKALDCESAREAPGLGEALSGQATLEVVAHHSNQLLWLVDQGDLIKQYEGGLSSERLNDLLVSAGNEFEAVLVIAQDLNLSLTQWLVSVIPTVLVEVELGTTKRRDVKAAQDICVSLAAELKALLIRPGAATAARQRLRRRSRRAEHVANGAAGSKNT